MGLQLALLAALVAPGAPPCARSVASGRLSVCLSAEGDVASVSVDGGPASAFGLSSRVGVRAAGSGSLPAVTQRFSPAPNNAVRWEVEISSGSPSVWGLSSPAEAAFSTLRLGPAAPSSVWLGLGAWPPPSDAGFFEPFTLPQLVASAAGRNGSAFLRMGCTPKGSTGIDALLCDASDGSGTATAGYNNGPPQWPIPMLTLLGQGSADAGLSIICAPNDTLVNTALEASAEQLSILNWNHRLGGSSAPLRFTRYIVAHDACWRPGLAWLAAEFPSYFESHPDSGSENLWGSGQYMDYRGNEEGDIESFWRRLNLTTNWDATFPWPWWGNYMPTEPEWLDCLPVGHNAPGTGVVQPWNRKYGKNTHLTKDWQCERMNHSAVRGWYDKLQRRLGAGTLYYGNAFEFGSWTVDPAEPLVGCDPMPAAGSGNHSAYCEANVALRKMADAILRTKGGGLLEETRGHASPCNPPPDGCGARIAPGMTIGDPGVESFQEFLLGVLRNQMEYTPGAGLAMDRQDHCVGFRIGGDDGVSYDAEHGGVTSHLGQGFKKIMRRFAKELHAQKQALFLSSTGNRRLDFSETMDGYFDEIGDSPGSFAVNGLLAINQPLVTWCHNYLGNFTSTEPSTGLSNVWSCGPACFDRFLAMHLLVGSSFTAPSPWGDHTNPTNPQTDGAYLAFAPLFELLRGKRWVLEPRAVRTNVSSVWSNIFTNAAGEVVIPLSYQPLQNGSTRPGCHSSAVKPGVAIASHNLVNMNLDVGDNASVCAAECCKHGQCDGWTYQSNTTARNGHCVQGPRPCCWLKSGKGLQENPSTIPSIVSGFVEAPAAHSAEPSAVDVTIRLPHSKFSIAGATVRHVGGLQQAVELRTCGDALCCSVALHRGCAALVLSTGRVHPLKADDTSLQGVNSTRQLVLFLDDKQLSETTGDITLQVNNPIKHEQPVLRPTEPWEDWGILFYQTVLFVAADDIRLYYSCAAQGPCPHGKNCDDKATGYRYTCLAISRDGGLSFSKPSLGVAVFNNSKANNIVWPPNVTRNADGRIVSRYGNHETGTVFIDDSPNAKPNERFKMVSTSTILGKQGLWVCASPDGIHGWRETSSVPAMTGSDTKDVAFFDHAIGRYAVYIRYYGPAPAVERPVRCADLGDGLRDAKRRIGRCEIDDITSAPWACNTHNSIDVFSFDMLDPFCLDVYTSQTTQYEHWSVIVNNATRSGRWTLFWPSFYSHIAFALHSGQSFPNDGLNQPRFLISRDGRNASYVPTLPPNRARRSWVDLGISGCSEKNLAPSRYPSGMEWCDDTRAAMDEDSWDTSQVFLASGIVTRGDEHFMYFSGSAFTHGDNAERPTWSGRNSGIGRLSIRKHGFASLVAGYRFPTVDKFGRYNGSELPSFTTELIPLPQGCPPARNRTAQMPLLYSSCLRAWHPSAECPAGTALVTCTEDSDCGGQTSVQKQSVECASMVCTRGVCRQNASSAATDALYGGCTYETTMHGDGANGCKQPWFRSPCSSDSDCNRSAWQHKGSNPTCHGKSNEVCLTRAQDPLGKGGTCGVPNMEGGGQCVANPVEGVLCQQPRYMVDGGIVLRVNIKSSVAGLAMFEVRDASGAPVPGRTLADADPIRGNYMSKTVKWAGSSSLSFLGDVPNGRAIRVHGAMVDAELFSIELSCSEAS